MELYLIRHGESEANFNNTHSGWSAVNLTETGRRQAEMARRHIQGIHFDKLFVSDVLRAQQTAEILFPGAERTYITIAREINNTALQGHGRDYWYEKLGEKYLECRKEIDYSPLGMDCESLSHLSGRAQELLDLASKMPEHSRIAVVCHALFIRALTGRVLELDPRNPALVCSNASICIFRCKNGQWQLKTWNLCPEHP